MSRRNALNDSRLLRLGHVIAELASSGLAERVGELASVPDRVIGFGVDAEIARRECAAAVKGVGAERSVPHQCEQPEVDVALTGPAQMMKPVPLVQRQPAPQ